MQSTQSPQQSAAEAEAPIWLQRASLTTLVVTCIYLGTMLVILPWTRYWQENRLVEWLPRQIAIWSQTGGARGLVSGLGLLDIWIGITEVVHWRKRDRRVRKTDER